MLGIRLEPICPVGDQECHDHLTKKGMKLPYTAPNPLPTDYRPELDVTPELGEAEALYYHTLIGVL